MKRILFALLFAGIAGGIFAQVVWGGFLEAGLQLKLPDEAALAADEHALPTLHRALWGSTAQRLMFQPVFTNSERTFGVSAEFGINNTTVSQNWYRGWVRPIPVLYIRLAQGASGFGYVAEDDYYGVHLIEDPFSGFTVGGFIIPTDISIKNSNYTFGFRYVVTNVFTAYATALYEGIKDDDERGKSTAGTGLIFGPCWPQPACGFLLIFGSSLWQRTLTLAPYKPARGSILIPPKA